MLAIPQGIGGGGGGLQAGSATPVYADVVPTDWTDLDLSGVTGAVTCLALLKITATSAKITTSNGAIYLRTNGDLLIPFNTSINKVATYYLENTMSSYAIVKTDANGIIEMKVNPGPQDLTIFVEAFIT